MLALVKGITSFIQGNTTLAAFAGVGAQGNPGPFWSVAPERTPVPYIVMSSVPGLSNLYGFSSGTYCEPAMIQFACYATDLVTATQNAETLCNALDLLSSLTLSGGQICRKPLRKEPVRPIQQPIYSTGERAYQAMALYTFRVQRTIGS